MGITDFLKANEISLDDVIEKVKASVHLAPSDVLFLCGSLLEGLGNEKSDLDLFLVTNRRDIPFMSLHDVALAVGWCLVDIRVVQRSDVEALLGRFNEWSRQPRQPRSAKAFTIDDRKLLHRLRSGRALYGAPEFARLQDALSPIDLARHLLDWARYFADTFQVDLAGLRSAGDPYSMLFAAQELLGHAMDALLADHHYSNPNPKWRIRQLSYLPDEWELALPGRRTGMSARDLYLSLHRAPESTAPRAILDHSLHIVALSRRLFPSVEYQLLHASPPPLPQAGPVDNVGDRPLPHLDLDVTVRYQDGRFDLLRLNARGQAFALSPREYSILCLFDGETTREYAVRYAEALWGTGSGADLVEQMVALVRHGEFEARPILDEQALAGLLRPSCS
jgi:hypothetical protein